MPQSCSRWIPATCLVAALSLMGCAEEEDRTAHLDRRPAAGMVDPNAPVNEVQSAGIVGYRVSKDDGINDARRSDAYRLMHETCGGKYRIDKEFISNDGAVTTGGYGVATSEILKRDVITFECLESESAAATVQTIWKDGALGTWTGVEAKLRTDVEGDFSFFSGLTEGPGGQATTALGISATVESNPEGHADLIAVALSGPWYAGDYFKAGHLRFNVRLAQPLGGKIILWYGNGKACNSHPINPADLNTKDFTAVSVPFSDFASTCGPSGQVTVPFHLTLRGCHYKPGTVLWLADLRWTTD